MEGLPAGAAAAVVVELLLSASLAFVSWAAIEALEA